VAVATFFFGADFSVMRSNLLDEGSPVISEWGPAHGFESDILMEESRAWNSRFIPCSHTGLSVYDEQYNTMMQTSFETLKKRAFINGGIFLIFFLVFLGLLLTATGYTITNSTSYNVEIEETPFKYLHNYIDLWWAGCALLIGVVLVALRTHPFYICQPLHKRYLVHPELAHSW